MRIPVNTITRRLFFSFGILVFNITIVSCLALFFLWHTYTVSKIGNRINNQRILIIQLIRTDLDFLRFETVNHTFYETGKSQLLTRRDSLLKVIQTENTTLYQAMVANEFQIESQFRQMDTLLAVYSQTFKNLTQRISARGFKDYGLEGTMRSYAHLLESMNTPITLTSLLMLRRHEKDFLLRKEEVYIKQFNELAQKLIRETNHEASVRVLLTYQELFNQLTEVNYEIGITPTEGLFGTLNSQTKLISAQLQQLVVLSAQRVDMVVRNSAMLFGTISLITVVLSTLLTYYTSTRLARPIKKLSQYMGKFIVNEGLNEKEVERDAETDEIKTLSQSFIKLSRKLKAQFSEIQQQNNTLRQLNDELDRFIYSAAHDLKSPLASMDGLIRLAEREINSREHGHYFQRMISSLRKLDGFIRDITDYAKNKRQQLKIDYIDLKAAMQEIVDSLQFLPNAKRIMTTISIEGEDFYTDKTRLDIILKNLISNSFRYPDLTKRESCINIEGVVSETELKLIVTDNGIGIDKIHIPRVFDMFYRAVEHSQGTGIGLFLVKESVKMLHGKIYVNSSLGEWTTFYLTIPNLKDGSFNSPEADMVISEEPLMMIGKGK